MPSTPFTLEPVPAPPKVSILVVVGTRPEAIKLIPIILALRASERFRPIVVTTGQHDLMVREVFKLAGIWADVTLWIGDTRARLNERVASTMMRFEDFFHQWFHEVAPGDATPEDVRQGRFPAAVLVHGDTSSAFGAALASFHLGIPVVHVEAGLRAGTGNMTPFPEELNRRLIARIACLHLAPTATNQENLVRENVPIKQIYVTGNSAIDALHWASGLDVPFVDPGGPGDVRQRTAPRPRHGPSPRELGRRPARESARRSRGSPTDAPRRRLRPAAPSQSPRPLRPSAPCSSRSRTCCCASPSATASSRACWPAAPSRSPTPGGSRKRLPRSASRCS